MSTRLDAQLQFSSAQAITADAISENVLDLGPLGGSNTIRDIAAAGNAGVMVQVSTVLDSAGEAATLTITVESDSTENLATSATVHATTTAITEATLVAGYVAYIPLPPGAYERYLGLRYTTGTEDFTSGAVNAWLVHGPQPTWRAYSDNSTNSA
jgi:hypothetical protein